MDGHLSLWKLVFYCDDSENFCSVFMCRVGEVQIYFLVSLNTDFKMFLEFVFMKIV